MSETKFSTDRFSWRCREVDSVLHLCFQGELEFQTVRLASAALRESLAGRRKTVVLDMSELSFMDSSGLGLLIRTKKDVEDCDGLLLVSRLSPAVKRLVDSTRLNAWFDPVDEHPQLNSCPVCDGALPLPARMCDRCGSAL